MKHAVFPPSSKDESLDMPAIARQIARHSARPRYTYMVLDLISTIAREDGRAGPFVEDASALIPIREWLANAMAPMASHHHRRLAMSAQVRKSLEQSGMLSDCEEQATAQVEADVRLRIRSSGMTAVSRAVSELVKAGLVKRHYQGFRVDHENRGAQRLAVYTVPAMIRYVLRTGRTMPMPRTDAISKVSPEGRPPVSTEPRQRSLFF